MQTDEAGTMGGPPLVQDIRRRVSALVPLLIEAGPEIDRIGKLPHRVVEAMDRAGVYRLGVPAQFGGHGDLPIRDVNEILIEVGKGNGSAGWSASINLAGAITLGFGDEAIREVFTSEHVGPLTSASIFNLSHAEGFGRKVPGGFMVRGSWSFSSNVRLSKWEIGAFDWNDNGTARRHFMTVPREEFKVADDWHVWGMQGSGSNSAYIPEEVFIPDYRTVPAEEFFHKSAEKGALRLAGPTANACVCIGMGYGALANFIEKAKKRAPWAQSYRTMADMASTQMLIARAKTTLSSCEASVLAWSDRLDNLRSITSVAASPGDSSLLEHAAEEQNGAAHAAADAIGRVRTIVMDLTTTLGSSCLLNEDGLGRFLRDVVAISLHVVHRPDWMAENYGKTLLGLQVAAGVAGSVKGNAASVPPAKQPRKLPILED